MSYQVLARKWRPRFFREMVGQEHVLKALINALANQRLHHAYLFTGTRGVGKTTIARILAKCLNCETGITPEPCGTCSSCREIAEGRFVDLIEVDAASRTRVEDTRELLENVQYAPTRGRYKIYLIDEVHMLSTHSFNALLKTLEEPPEHVKFLLATTDPQKLPVTVLSRCLQFHLKNMSPERIVQHLQHILGQEQIPVETSALWHLARAADGSMRDALSLTDQAIAHGGGTLVEADVVSMLGTIDHRLIEHLVRALAQNDGRALLQAVAQFAETAPDYAGALADLTLFLHRLALCQALPEAIDNSFGDEALVLELAQALPAEAVQLFYQTALIGRRDLPWAPDARTGFEMTLLRMLAFRPQGLVDLPREHLGGKPLASEALRPPLSAPPAEALAPAAVASAEPSAPDQAASDTGADTDADFEVDRAADAPPWANPVTSTIATTAAPDTKPIPEEAPSALARLRQIPELAALQPASQLSPKAVAARQAPATDTPQSSATASATLPLSDSTQPDPTQPDPDNWLAVFQHLNVKGVLGNILGNCVLVARQGQQLAFILDETKAALFDETHRQRLQELISDYCKTPYQVAIQPGQIPADALTPAQDADHRKQAAREAALAKIQQEPIARALVTDWQANLDDASLVLLTPSS